MSYIENSLVSIKPWKSWSKFYASAGSLSMCIALLDVRSMLGVGILVFISIYLNNNGGNMKTLVLNFSHIVTSGLLQYSDIFKWGKVS